jgi:hypothetical protein
VRPLLSILACGSGLLPKLHLDHNLELILYYVVSFMQALLSVLAVAWVTILWPLRRTRSYFFALLVPMVRSPAVSSPPQPQVAQWSQDPGAMEIIPAKIKKRRASK